jgi:5-methylthioadenosine/S-adenosylhomocysteine deaminase
LSRYLVRADPVVTMDGQGTLLPDGAVIVNGHTIESVGPGEQLAARGPFERVLGGSQFILIPGLSNMHHHTVITPQRDYAAQPFELREHWYMYTGTHTEEELYWLNMWHNIQMLKAGTTSAVGYYYGLKHLPDDLGINAVMKAYVDSGLRIAIGIAARDRLDIVHSRTPEEFTDLLPPELRERLLASNYGYLYDTDQLEAITRRLVKQYHASDSRIRVFASPDWTPSSTDDLYRRMKRLAQELDTGIVTHLLETPYEALHSIRTYGKTATRRLADLEFLGPEVTCTDCVWLTEDDVQILADTGVTATYCPHITDFSGIAPVRAMLDKGVRVAFSHLSRSVNDGYDTLFDLGLGERLQHVPGIHATTIPAQSMLRMATADGGHAWALDDSLGSLEAGKLADLVMLDKGRLYSDPLVADDTDIYRMLIYRCKDADVNTVIVNGDVVVEGGTVLTVNEETCRQNAKIAAVRVHNERGADAQPLMSLVRELEPYNVNWYSGWSLEEHIEGWDTRNARNFRDFLAKYGPESAGRAAVSR